MLPTPAPAPKKLNQRPKKNTAYLGSFTTGGLFLHESVRLATLYLQEEDWHVVRQRTLAENLLQVRTINSRKRISSDIISRLKLLNPGELTLLCKGDYQEQAYLLWLAVCRRYQFIGDFAEEILREHLINFKTELSYEDFDYFFNQKALWHEKLDEISLDMRKKLRQVLFKMLREANLLTSDNLICRAVISSTLLKLIAQHNPDNILFFPMFVHTGK